MAQRVKMDQGKVDWVAIKGIGMEHPFRNQSLLTTLGDHAKMPVPVGVFGTFDKNVLPAKWMIRIAKRRAASLMMGNILSLRSPARRRCSLTCRATPTPCPAGVAKQR